MRLRITPSTFRTLASAFVVAAACGSATLAQAQTQTGSSVSSADASKPAQPQMTLSANAWSEVTQDTVNVSVAIEVTGADQPATGRMLSKELDAAMKIAKSDPAVTAHTGSIRVWAINNSKGKPTGWRGHGEIVLQSKKFDAASALASKLGDKSAISNVYFSLSREAREDQERKLLAQAADAFRARASAAAKAFGFSDYRIAKLELGGSGGEMARPAVYAMAKSAMAAAPADVAAPLAPDTVNVSVDVSGTIVLQ